eukprot:scaffold13536_cov60-Phaeocystis_antarctica.AAC.2
MVGRGLGLLRGTSSGWCVRCSPHGCPSGVDTTTRTEIETAGSGKDLGFGFGPSEPAAAKQHLTLSQGRTRHPQPLQPPPRSRAPEQKRLRAYGGDTGRCVVGRAVNQTKYPAEGAKLRPHPSKFTAAPKCLAPKLSSGTETRRVGPESTLSTLPCLGRCTGSGGHEDPLGGAAEGCNINFHTKTRRPAPVSPSARRIPHDEGRLKWPDQCHPDSRETMTPHAR